LTPSIGVVSTIPATSDDTGNLSRRFERDDLNFAPLMEGVQLCTKSLRRSAERGIGDMCIPFCRRWIGMAEEAANYFKAEAARNR
jgi:hypothetical protein